MKLSEKDKADAVRCPIVLIDALRQYQHNNCSGFVLGFDYHETLQVFEKIEQRILELEMETVKLEEETEEQKAHINHLMETCKIFTPVNLAIRDLEQQAKGVEDLIKEFLLLACDGMRNKALKLRNQAKQLKGCDL